MTVNLIDVVDPADPRLDDFRDLNSVDRRPDLPSGKGLVIAEGVLVVQRMLASRFRPRAMLGTDRRLDELEADLAGVEAPYYRVDADVMAEVIGFHLNRGVLASASRPPELTVAPSKSEVSAGTSELGWKPLPSPPPLGLSEREPRNWTLLAMISTAWRLEPSWASHSRQSSRPSTATGRPLER